MVQDDGSTEGRRESVLVLPSGFKGGIKVPGRDFAQRTRKLSEDILGFLQTDEHILSAENFPMPEEGGLSETEYDHRYLGSHHFKLLYALGFLDREQVRRKPAKRFRPMLVDLICESMGKSPERLIAAKVAIEILHGASLVIDDMDDRERRRYGLPAFYRRFGEAVARNFSNKMTSNASGLVSKVYGEAFAPGEGFGVALTDHISDTVNEMATGQLLEIDVRAEGRRKRYSRYNREVLAEIQRKKTGLFGLSAKVALTLYQDFFKNKEDFLTAIGFFEKYLGVFAEWFQGMDDLKDYRNDMRHKTPNLVGVIKNEDGVSIDVAYRSAINHVWTLQQRLQYAGFLDMEALPLNVRTFADRVGYRLEIPSEIIIPSEDVKSLKKGLTPEVAEKV
ncbi:MAG: polyprenyl synthetase family protein [archaeon]|nr:polyprenyl synthetase family protein [archaeon]